MSTKMNNNVAVISLLLLMPMASLALSSCTEQPPTGKDMEQNLKFTALDSDKLVEWHNKAGIKDVYYSHLVYDGETLGLLLGGSSSCPPQIDVAHIEPSTNNVSITLKPIGNKACTADYGPYGWTAEIPMEAGPDVKVNEAYIVNVDAEQPQKLTVVNVAESEPNPIRKPTVPGSAEPRTAPPATGTADESVLLPTAPGVEPTANPHSPLTLPAKPTKPVYSLPVEADLK